MRVRAFLTLALRFALSGAAISAATISACNTAPTLPLPPPVVDVGSPNSQGLVEVRGDVLPQAYVSVFNERTSAGVIVRADDEGAFEAEIAAEVGDTLTVWAEIDGELSERTRRSVPAPR